MTYCIEIRGKPQGKERPRVVNFKGRARAYTPERTKSYEDLVGWTWRQQGYKVLQGALRVEIDCYFVAKGNKQEKGRLNGKQYIGKPDSDNIAKVVLDALNGVAFEDDSQVAELLVTKQYGNEPRVHVTIEEM